jgi:hypothetical protein
MTETPPQQQKEIVKAVILVSGSEVEALYVANVAAPGAAPALGLVPTGRQPAGIVYTPNVDMFPPPASSALPFTACATAYAALPFRQKGWKLFAGRISSLLDLQALFAQALAIGPAAVVLHYVGHGIFLGGAGAVQEAWSCRGRSLKRMNWTDPAGVVIAGALLCPDDGVVNALVPLDAAKAAMQQFFPNIPLTLITDACEHQGATRLAAGPAFRVIVCDSVAGPRLVIEGAFSAAWAAAPVVPSCFAPDDVPANTRPPVLNIVNAALAPVPPAAAGGPHVAASVPP